MKDFHLVRITDPNNPDSPTFVLAPGEAKGALPLWAAILIFAVCCLIIGYALGVAASRVGPSAAMLTATYGAQQFHNQLTAIATVMP